MKNSNSSHDDIYYKDYISSKRKKKISVKNTILFILSQLAFAFLLISFIKLLPHLLESKNDSNISSNSESANETTFGSEDNEFTNNKLDNISVLDNESNIIYDDSNKEDTTDTSKKEIEIYEEDDYIWNFDTSIEEQNGLKTEVFGDTHLVEINDGILDGKAAYFDGDGDYIYCGKEINLSEDFTFSTLLCCEDVEKKYASFFAKYEVDHKGPYAFSIYKGHVNIWITVDENNNYFEMNSVSKIMNNEWYHIAIVKEGYVIKLYINGELDNKGEIDGCLSSNDSVTIGRQALLFSPVDQLQFKGYISQINIDHRALSDNDINRMYNKSLKDTKSNLDLKCTSNIVNGGLVTSDEEYDYFSSIGNLVKVSQDSNNVHVLLEEQVYYLNNDSKFLYFTKGTNDKIYRMKKDGEDLVCLYDYNSHELTLYKGMLYFCSDMGTGSYHICRMNNDGSGFQILEDCNEWYMTIYRNRIFYTDYEHGRKMYSIGLDGTDKKLLNSSKCYDICIIADHIFYSEGDGRKLYKMDMNGENKEKIIDLYAKHTTYWDSKLFFINERNDLCCCNLDGSNYEICFDDDVFSFLNIGNKGLYYQDGQEEHSLSIISS